MGTAIRRFIEMCGTFRWESGVYYDSPLFLKTDTCLLLETFVSNLSSCVLQVRLVRLVGIMLIVFVKKEHEERLYDILSSHVATGLMGMMVRHCGFGNPPPPKKSNKTTKNNNPDWG